MKTSFSSTLLAALLISGTTIGAGMLGIPLITAQLGVIPATVITFVVWLFMLITGFLFLEATLWMPANSNVLTITGKILGENGKWWGGATFVFLYYSLMTAYFAAIVPILQLYSPSLSSGEILILFTLIFGTLLAFGIRWVGRVNLLLMAGLILSYFLLLKIGFPYLSLGPSSWSIKKMGFSTPILFSAFGFHNIIPSLTYHFGKNRTLMRRAIFIGTLLPFLVYLLWQWLIMGILPLPIIQETLSNGSPITAALSEFLQKGALVRLGNVFAFFAILTSMLGVALSMIDFFADGLKLKNWGKDRVKLCFLTLLPPAFFSFLDPKIFVTALSIAGGFGETFLNGILPTLLVWKGAKKYHFFSFLSEKPLLFLLFLFSFMVISSEVIFLFQYS